MTSVWALIAGFFVANFLWFLAVWNHASSDNVTPKFISSSYDPNINTSQELESVLLKSLSKHINKYFNPPTILSKLVGDLPLDTKKTLIEDSDSNNSGLSLNMTQHEVLKNFISLHIDNSSKISIFLNPEKTMVNILQITRDKESLSRFEYKHGEVALYSIPLDNFLIQSKSQYSIGKSLMVKCWSTRFHGRIIGAVSSNDKHQLVVFYRVVRGHTISYRLRYFHSMACDNPMIERYDETLSKEYLDYISGSSSGRKTEERPNEENDYFEIREGEGEEENGNSHNHKKKTFRNFFNDQAYDDFALRGNSPISSMAISKNIIAYARDVDYRQFYIIKRESHLWKVSLLGPKINRTVHNFFHTNSLKFAKDQLNDYKLIHIYLSINTTGIFSFADVIKANHTDCSDRRNVNNYIVSHVIRSRLDNEILNINEIFNIETAIQRVKKFMKPTVFSNSLNNGLTFEFISGTLCHLGWTEDNREYSYVFNESEEKVSKMSSDATNENILVKYENKDLTYIHSHNIPNMDDDYAYFDKPRSISLKSLPKKFREKEAIAFLIEKINDKLILLLLNEDGILVALDFTAISQKLSGRGRIIDLLFNDFNYTLGIIIIANLITLVIYLRIFSNRRIMTEMAQRRTNEINQVLQDIFRLNSIQALLSNSVINNGNEVHAQHIQGGHLTTQPRANENVANSEVNPDNPIIENIH